MSNREPKEFYLIPTENFENFEKGMKKLANKAKRLQIEPIPSFEVLETVTEERRVCVAVNEYGQCVKSKKINFQFKKVKVEGVSPTVNGYEFVGTIEHEKVGNIIRVNSGLEDTLDLTPYRQGSQKCEHCNHKRARKDTYLVHSSEENRIIQVGRTCLKDFMGHKSPQFFAECAEYLRELVAQENDPSSGGWFKASDYINLVELVSIAYAVTIFDNGYKNASHEGRSTKSQTMDVLFPITNFTNWKSHEIAEYKENHRRINEYARKPEVTEKVKKSIEYHAKLEPKNDFEHNLFVIANSEEIHIKNTGFACYLMQSYFKFEELEAKKKKKEAEEALKKDEYIGTVGKREVFENMKYIRTGGFAHDYGYTYFHSFEDSEGRKMVVKGSTGLNDMIAKYNCELQNEIRDNHTYDEYHFTFKATVKKQEVSTFHGKKETTVNRVVIQDMKKID